MNNSKFLNEEAEELYNNFILAYNNQDMHKILDLSNENFKNTTQELVDFINIFSTELQNQNKEQEYIGDIIEEDMAQLDHVDGQVDWENSKQSDLDNLHNDLSTSKLIAEKLLAQYSGYHEKLIEFGLKIDNLNQVYESFQDYTKSHYSPIFPATVISLNTMEKYMSYINKTMTTFLPMCEKIVEQYLNVVNQLNLATSKTKNSL